MFKFLRKASNATPPPGAKRRLKDLKISFVSLCKRGANGIRTALKSVADGSQPLVEFQSMSKMDSEGLLYTVIYAPDLVDSDGEYCTPEDVRKACHGYFANGGQVDIHHNLDPLDTSASGAINICEHGIIQKGDERPWPRETYKGEPFDPTYSWGTIYKILDPELRAGYESGEWDGVSMYGLAIAEPVGKSETPNQENNMDTKDITEAVEKGLEGLGQNIAEQVAAALTKSLTPKPADDDVPGPIEFEGDHSNPEDVRKHLDKVRLSKLDWSDEKAVEGYLASIEKAGDPADVSNESEELRTARAELAKAQAKVQKFTSASRQGAGEDQDGDTSEFLVGLGKEHNDRFNAGISLHQRWAKRLGRKTN